MVRIINCSLAIGAELGFMNDEVKYLKLSLQFWGNLLIYAGQNWKNQ